MANKMIQQLASALIEKIKSVPRSEGHSFNVGIEFAGHSINAEYFHGTLERDGFYDIFPGMRVTIDNSWYAYRWLNVTAEIERAISVSEEYKNLQQEYEKYVNKLFENEDF